MQNNTFETLMGAVVILVAAGFLYFAYTSTSVGSLGGYELGARFASADGIATGTDVRLHGIKIGRQARTVRACRINPSVRTGSAAVAQQTPGRRASAAAVLKCDFALD